LVAERALLRAFTLDLDVPARPWTNTRLRGPSPLIAYAIAGLPAHRILDLVAVERVQVSAAREYPQAGAGATRIETG
jgi:hypothetical protein